MQKSTRTTNRRLPMTFAAPWTLIKINVVGVFFFNVADMPGWQLSTKKLQLFIEIPIHLCRNIMIYMLQ